MLNEQCPMKYVFIILASIFLFSCARNVEEDLKIDSVDDSVDDSVNDNVDDDVTLPEETSFSTDIEPILSDRCIKCHGNENSSWGLNFETYEGVLVSVSPGEPEQSLLYGVVSHTDGSAMPKGEDKLTDLQIEKIRNWILDGAKND